MTECVCKDCDWQATNGDVCEPCADEGCGKSNLTPYSQGFRAGQAFEQKRIINLMNSHRVVFIPQLSPVLNCNKCGDVTQDQPSHLMRLIEGNENG